LSTQRINNTLGQIGKTPLIAIAPLDDRPAARVWGKLEAANPGGSVKDRIALAMVENAEAKGYIHPGDLLVEPTSGNTGIGLSLVCAIKDYRLILTMPDTMSDERRRLLGAYGAGLVLTPDRLGMRGAIEKAEAIAAEQKGYLPQQFSNPANPEIHRRTTGPEILAALDGKVDAFVTGVGTGGTLTGVGQALREANVEAEIIAVEPTDSAVLSGRSPGPHKIQGIGAGFIPEVLDTDLYTDVMTIGDAEAIQTAHDLARQQGIFSGISSGANILAAFEVARRLGPDCNVVTTICDTGERYLSTGAFD